MESAEEECQARRARDRDRHYIDNSDYHHHRHPLLQNIPPAPVWNRGRGRRHYITPLYVPPNLDEAIADLHR